MYFIDSIFPSSVYLNIDTGNLESVCPDPDAEDACCSRYCYSWSKPSCPELKLVQQLTPCIDFLPEMRPPRKLKKELWTMSHLLCYMRRKHNIGIRSRRVADNFSKLRILLASNPGNDGIADEIDVGVKDELDAVSQRSMAFAPTANTLPDYSNWFVNVARCALQPGSSNEETDRFDNCLASAYFDQKSLLIARTFPPDHCEMDISFAYLVEEPDDNNCNHLKLFFNMRVLCHDSDLLQIDLVVEAEQGIVLIAARSSTDQIFVFLMLMENYLVDVDAAHVNLCRTATRLELPAMGMDIGHLLNVQLSPHCFGELLCVFERKIMVVDAMEAANSAQEEFGVEIEWVVKNESLNVSTGSDSMPSAPDEPMMNSTPIDNETADVTRDADGVEETPTESHGSFYCCACWGCHGNQVLVATLECCVFVIDESDDVMPRKLNWLEKNQIDRIKTIVANFRFEIPGNFTCSIVGEKFISIVDIRSPDQPLLTFKHMLLCPPTFAVQIVEPFGDNNGDKFFGASLACSRVMSEIILVQSVATNSAKFMAGVSPPSRMMNSSDMMSWLMCHSVEHSCSKRECITRCELPLRGLSIVRIPKSDNIIIFQSNDLDLYFSIHKIDESRNRNDQIMTPFGSWQKFHDLITKKPHLIQCDKLVCLAGARTKLSEDCPEYIAKQCSEYLSQTNEDGDQYCAWCRAMTTFSGEPSVCNLCGLSSNQADALGGVENNPTEGRDVDVTDHRFGEVLKEVDFEQHLPDEEFRTMVRSDWTVEEAISYCWKTDFNWSN